MPVCVIAMPAATPAFAAHMLILPGDEIALVGDHVLDRGRPQASSSRRTR